MSKIKVDSKILAVLILVGLFAGWQYLLLASGFALVVAHDDEKVMDTLKKVVVLLASITLFLALWNIIYTGYGVFEDAVEGIFKILNSFNNEWLMPTWINSYVLNPLRIIFEVLDKAIDLIVIITKFAFVVAIISSKSLPKAFSKIEEYSNLFGSFIADKVNISKTKTEASTHKQEEKNTKICPNCGNELSKTATFCNKCGTKQ